MPDPRNPRFEDVPQSAYLDPAAFIQAIQAQEQQEFDRNDEDRGILGIATLVLAGVGGFAALKHFPPRRIRALAGEIKDILIRPKDVGLQTPQIDKIRAAMNNLPDAVLKQPWSAVHRDKFGQVLGKIDAANDPEMLRTLKQIFDLTSVDPKFFASSSQAQKVIKTHLIRPIPQDASGLRQITLGDLFDSSGGWQQKLWNTSMPESLSELQNVTKGLVRIPGLADNIKLFNMGLDPNLLVNRLGGGNAIELVARQGVSRHLPSSFSVSGVIKGIQKTAADESLGGWAGVSTKMIGIGAAAGFAAGYDSDSPLTTAASTAMGAGLGAIPVKHLARIAKWGMEIFTPTELLKQQPGLTIFNGSKLAEQFLGEAAARKGVSGAIVAGGKVYPIFGTKNRRLGGAIASGVRVGRTDSAMGRAAKIRMGAKWLDKSLAESGKTSAQVWLEGKERELGRPVNPVIAALVHMGDKLGVGPQFKRGRMVGDIDDMPVGENIPRTIGEIFTDPAKVARRAVLEAFESVTGKSAASRAGVEEHYAFRPAEGLKDWANYSLLRVSRLLEQTTGGALALKAGETPWQTAKHWMALGVGGMVAVEGLRYVDYHTRRITGTGPISAPLQAYTAVRNTQQHLFAALGIQQTSAYMEELMPGSINSPASALIRTAATYSLFRGRGPFSFLGRGVEGSTFGTKFGAGLAAKLDVSGLKYGKALAGLAAATQLTDITESPAHLAAVYRGEVDVPVREGRFWALGHLPFTGGRVTHTRPHLIPTILSHAREIGTYGSEGAYWGRQFGVPTPESFFGLRPLLFPYETEQQNYATRPYPLTGPMVGVAGNIPLVGELFNRTVGEIIKPTQQWHGPVREPALGGLGAQIGFSPIYGQRTIGDPTSIIETLGKQIDLLRDFTGMPGFLVGALKHQLTGDANFDLAKRQLATAGQMTGMERAYYDMTLGGGLGMTELLRRFIPHRRRDIEQVNPILNQMPAWLPGSQSAFPEDREFYRDFHRGDPMAAMKSGEARLPGPGYEALHRLHSGVPGVYSPLDRWKILRDVAPTSQAFRHYDAIVSGWARTQSARARDPNPLVGLPGSRTMSGVVKAVLDGDTIVVDSNGRLINVRVAGADAPEMAHTRFEASMPNSISGELAKRRLENEVLGKPVMLDPRDIDVYGRTVADVRTTGMGRRDISEELREAFGTYDLSQTDMGQIQTARQYLRDRFEPYPFSRRIFRDPLQDVPRNMRDLTTSSITSLNRAIKQEGEYSLPEKLVGNVWEQLTHGVSNVAPIGTPIIGIPGRGGFNIRWPIDKLLGQKDPLEYYRDQMLRGGAYAQWETPVRSFVTPWANQMVGSMFPAYVPGNVSAQRQALAEQDALEYRRNAAFAGYASSIGNEYAAAQFKRRSMRTAAGVILHGNRRSARSALSRIERGFYDDFSMETSEAMQGRILENVSPQMGSMLKMAWGEDMTLDRAQAQSLVEGAQAPNSWAGMHPDVPSGALRAKVAHDHAWDFHDIGVTQSENYIYEDIFSDNMIVPAPPDLFSASVHAKSITMGHRLGLRNHTINTVDSLFGPSVSMRISKDTRQYERVLNTYGYSPTAQGMRF